MQGLKSSKVILLKCRESSVYRVQNALEEGLELLGGIGRFVKKGEKILLKPNLLAADPPETATCTHPSVFEATARILKKFGAEVMYGDSPCLHPPLRALKRSGLQEVAERLNLIPADFELSRRVYYGEAKQNRVFEIAEGVFNADGIISLPKLKTHGFTLLTCAIKNQFGCIPGMAKSGYHAKLEELEQFSQMLVDLTMLLKPKLYIMDGIIAMEGNGPRKGNPVELGALLISQDPVAMDAVASRLVGVEPERIMTTLKGHESRAGTMLDIELIGDEISEIKRKIALPTDGRGFHSMPLFIRRGLKRLMVHAPVIQYKRCTACLECHRICPSNPKSIVIRDDGFPMHVYRTCIRCYCCQETCPEGAIILKRKIF
jgi:uncharacterized protein (DUF362 family)/Pyruvate/2-oxoacid:ferredoxin oxidoreductase delta subunit